MPGLTTKAEAKRLGFFRFYRQLWQRSCPWAALPYGRLERLTAWPKARLEVDDDELLRQCQRRDNSAMELLVQRFQDRIFRLACRVLADAARAEDATADALAVVWDRCRSWRGEARAATWIHQVAWRVVLDHQRARRRWWRFWELNQAAETCAYSLPDPPASADAREQRELTQQRVSLALGQLSADERALVHWHYFEDLSLAEIAEIMGATRDALKMRLSRTREKLRRLLGEQDESE